MRKPPSPARAARGFTLIEAVCVIALTGIVGAIVGVFIRAPINAYMDQARRAELSDAADTALRRMARDVQRALPNSLRVDAAGQALEFLPVVAGGRYRAAPGADSSGDWLDVDSPSDGSFDVLGFGVTVAPGDELVIYNLSETDAYGGASRRTLTSSGANLANLSYAVGGTPFPFTSPGNRFQVVSTPVSFLCSPAAGGAGTLRRYGGYPIQAAQPTDPGAAPLAGLSPVDDALLANHVRDCRFDYSADASMRNALLTLTLTLESGGESVTLMHQVQVDNSP